MNIPIVYKELWSAEENRLLKEMQSLEVGSINHWVADCFYQAAKRQVRLIREHEMALSLSPWAFYQMRGKTLASYFNQ